jgi:hypothetical protein
LIAQFHVKINGWASNAGKRVLISAGVFTAPEKHMFEHAERVHPIYFEYPHEKVDEVAIMLPAGWQVDSVPSGQQQEHGLLGYSLKAESDNDNDTLHLTRKLKVDFIMLTIKDYPALRSFFQFVRTGDEEQIVLQPSAATATN